MKILIVEDEPAFARELAETLQGWGYQVLQHLSGYQQTLQWLGQTEEPPDAAILDLRLGSNHNRDGLKIADVLFKEYNIPFIFNSGLDDSSTAHLTAEYGAAQVAKEEWKSLKNALIHIEVGRKVQAHQSQTDSLATYETARIGFNDADNRGAEIIINLSNILWWDTQPDNRASRIVLHVKEGNQIKSYRNGHGLSSFFKELDKRFPSLNLADVFIRINKNAFINKNHISKRVSDEIYIGEESFTIGDSYKEELKKYLPPKI